MTFRARYGASPVHLLAHLALLPLAAWALLTVLDFRAASNVVLWLVGAVILHDLVLLPAYSALDRVARVAVPGAINYVRVPGGLALLSLLVFHLRPRFELIRRVHQIGGPYAIAFDRERRGLWITVARTNQLVHYAAGSRPVLRETFPSIRNARDVTVAGDDVTVSSESENQRLRIRSR